MFTENIYPVRNQADSVFLRDNVIGEQNNVSQGRVLPDF